MQSFTPRRCCRYLRSRLFCSLLWPSGPILDRKVLFLANIANLALGKENKLENYITLAQWLHICRLLNNVFLVPAGDLWSYNSEEDVFVVSPEPDTFVYPIDISKHRCLILGTDGAWNMLTPAQVGSLRLELVKDPSSSPFAPEIAKAMMNQYYR